ncbi:hypothetical protein Clacol_010568 [Clathrus columnatus]|uniref:Cyclin-like domain-containing protein n=1 Tax=Clathrus columnatus TaxID=1419009 RepID=A0AAV5AR75_9AGAM|nr:hypothetical protein Clacol_010568 [Clathrus columnatus]
MLSHGDRFLGLFALGILLTRQTCSRRWIVDRTTLAQARQDDSYYATEDHLALLGIFFANLISKLGKKLDFRQRVVATAIVFFRRFYLKNSYCETDPFLVAAACCYVAAKAEETPVHIKNVVMEARSLFSSDEYDIKTFPSDNSKLAEMEFYLVDDLECDLTVFHPYRTLLTLCGKEGDSGLETEDGSMEAEAGEVGAGIDDPRYWGTGQGKLELPEPALQMACIQTQLASRSGASASVPNAVPRRSSRQITTLPFTKGKGKERVADIVGWLAGLNISMTLIATVAQEIISLYCLWDRFSDDNSLDTARAHMNHTRKGKIVSIQVETEEEDQNQPKKKQGRLVLQLNDFSPTICNYLLGRVAGTVRMARTILASVHVSSIYPPSHGLLIPIDTVRRDIPLPEIDPDTLQEHASYGSTFSSPETGTIFIRIIHGGLILELITLSTGKATRFAFPAPILPAPTILLHQLSEVNVFVVTTSGSLFTLMFPVLTEENVPIFDVSSTNGWCKEYVINTPAEDLEGPVHVKDIDCVVISLSKGRFLRLDSGQDYGTWHESIHRVKTTWTSYLVSGSENSQIVSFASHPPPSDSAIIFSLSRDYTLRAWNSNTCIASYSFKNLNRSTVSPMRGETPSNEIKMFSDLESPNLLRVLPSQSDETEADENLRVLMFLSSPASPETGGHFHLFCLSANNKELTHIKSIACPTRTIGTELRDFQVSPSTLYALWDKQGSSVVERISFDPDQDTPEPEVWQASSYPSEVELTPDYLDELLLRSGGGSLIDTFISVLLCPGLFSHFTIETALQQYTDALLSAPSKQPPLTLKQSYITLTEHVAAVVGSSVELTIDPRTGVPQRDNYWSALKRDWEGFIARCREIERSGRWPLALGSGPDSIILLERERIGRIAVSDWPLRVNTNLNDAEDVQVYNVLNIATSVRQKLSNAEIHAREAQFEMMVSQEHSYSYAESLEHCVASIDDPREDITQYVLEELMEVEDLNLPLDRALDIITTVDSEVKVEDSEPSLDENNIPLPATRWERGVVTAYINASIDARYGLCSSLVLLLFQIGDHRRELSPALLSRFFAVFRNICISRYLSRQPAGDPDGTTSAAIEQDLGVLRNFQNMTLSNGQRSNLSSQSPTYSLVYRLMDEVKSAEGPLPETAFAHFRMMSLLTSYDVAETTHYEVSLCKWLLDLGFRDTALEILGKMARSPGITYVHGLILVRIGRPQDGASLLQRVGASFAPGAVLSEEDSAALRHVLPKITTGYNEYSYYKWVAIIFETEGYLAEAVKFHVLAIECAGSDIDTSELWRKVITGYLELEMFEDSYMALVTTPYDNMYVLWISVLTVCTDFLSGRKREAISQLVQAMCEANAVDRLLSLNFVGLPNEVETALAFKVRNADPLSRPMYPQVLYAWYVFRGDFRNAAATMYQFARRLSPFMEGSSQFVVVAEMQAEAYLVAINALSLLDPKNAWIALPIPSEILSTGKKPKFAKHVPSDKYQLDSRDVEIIDLNDLQREYTLVNARLDLMKRHPDLSAPTRQQIVSKYAQEGSYDYAFSAAQILQIDMTETFERLAIQCLRLSRRGESYLAEDGTTWLHSEKVSSWPGSPIERGWRYLRTALEQYDSSNNEYAYRKAVSERILEFDRSNSLPSWLVLFFQDNQPEFLIRMFLRFELICEALEYSLSLVRKSEAAIPRNRPRGAGITWLPYNLLEIVISTASISKNLTPTAHNQLRELKDELTSRVKRMQKWSTAGVLNS